MHPASVHARTWAHVHDKGAIRVEDQGSARRARPDERGLSQRGFAALIGMSPTYLADIERGARNVSIDNMKRIADGFGVTFHEMTEGME